MGPVRVNDTTLSLAEEQRCFLLGLQCDRVIYLHYVTSFRVVRGAVKLLGGVVCASTKYQTVVTSSWRGCETLRALTAVSRNSCGSDRSQCDTPCGLCHGACGLPDGSLCAIIRAWPKGETLICFRDVTTAFGICRASVFVTDVPAFPTTIEYNHTSWTEESRRLVFRCLERRFSASKTPLGESVMITGQRGLGKATFCCYVVNSLLSVFDKVAVLDADVSHPLLGAPGSVSLHIVDKLLVGDSHSLKGSHQLLAIFTGALSPDVDPTLYLSAVGQCWCTYQQLISGALYLAASSERDHQQVSLFSPSCLPSSALRAGVILPRLNPEVSQSTWPEDATKVWVPLIIYGQGWTSGLGWQLTMGTAAITWCHELIEIFKDTEAINDHHEQLQQLKTNKDGKNNAILWGTELDISYPFTEIVERFYGRLPLMRVNEGRDTLYQPHLRRISSVVPEKDVSPSQKDHKLRGRRWLQWMRTFHEACRFAVHAVIATEEQFFHGATLPSNVQVAGCWLAERPKLFSLRFRGPEGHYKLHICVVGLSTLDMNATSDVVALLTGTVVALCSGCPAAPCHTIWCSAAPWNMITYAWIHSVNLQEGTMAVYVPAKVSTERMEEVTLLAVGLALDFTPCPETNVVMSFPSTFPHHDALQQAVCLPNKTPKSVTTTRRVPSTLHVPCPTVVTPDIVTALRTFKADRHRTVSENVRAFLLSLTLMYQTPFYQEFVFKYIKTGKKRSGRTLIPRKCHL